MHALIIGAGIAGPSLAAFLRRVGLSVTLCESRPGPAAREGAFLALAPNGMAVLRELGAADAVREAGSTCLGFDFLNAQGKLIAQIDTRDAEARYGSPLVLVRRDDLHRALLAVAQRAGVTARFGSRLVRVDSGEGHEVRASFQDGAEIVADMAIGCDGIRSTTRSVVLPDSPAPRFLDQSDVGGYARADGAPIPPSRNVMVFGRRAFFGAFRRADGEI